MKNKAFVVANTKGGSGKSVVATMILPLLFQDKLINISEIDNNNETKFTNTRINFSSIKIERQEEVINNVYFDFLHDGEITNIIDAGGGDDTIEVLEYLQKIDISGITYLVPCNDDIEQFDNAINTIKNIRLIDSNAKIYLILNRCLDISNENAIKEQFLSIFGSVKYGIDSNLHLLENIEILFVPNTRIFGILKNIYSTTLSDFIIEAEDLVVNIEEYRQNWAGQGKEQFSKNMKRYTFAKDVIKLKNQLTSFEILR